MAVTGKRALHFLYSLATKKIDLSADTVKVLAMRSGFVFDEVNHNTLINLKATTGATTLSVVATTKKFTRAAGSFVTDGFVAGNKITSSGFTNAGNNGTWIIASVAALEIVVVTGTGMVDETGGGDEQIVADDELATGFGYTQNTKTTGAITVTKDNTAKRVDATFPPVTWTASGGSIGPSPGYILYDDTSSDDTIVGYIDNGGETTTTDGNPRNITNGIIRLTSPL